MKSKKAVAMLTVGHSPREDIIPELRNLLNPKIEIIHRGALDKFSLEEVVSRFSPSDGEATMVSRLSNGEMGTFSAAKVMPFIQASINSACLDGANCVVLLCTNRFTNLCSPVPLIVPFFVMHSLIQSIHAGMRIGALFPFESHAVQMATWWKEFGIELDYLCVNPEAQMDFEFISSRFRNTDLLILDCIGYTGSVRKELSQRLDIPIISPRALIADLVNSFLAEPVAD